MFIKMANEKIQEKIEIPDGITIRKEGELVVIEGLGGSVKKKLDSPIVIINVKADEIILETSRQTKREKAMINTYKAHLLKGIKGVQEPYMYKLKICSGHFPMNVSVSNNVLIIKNFLGEKVPRKVEIRQGAKVTVKGNEIMVESPDKDLAGQVSADIEQRTRRPGFDKRIFQDGIYITEKAGKKI